MGYHQVVPAAPLTSAGLPQTPTRNAAQLAQDMQRVYGCVNQRTRGRNIMKRSFLNGLRGVFVGIIALCALRVDAHAQSAGLREVQG